MTAGYRIDITCPRCGNPVQHLTAGTSNGTSTRAICRCPTCRDDWIIEVRALSVNGQPVHARPEALRRPPAQCGTESGYTRHRRNGQPPCAACRTAHSSANRRRALGASVDNGSRPETVGMVNA